MARELFTLLQLFWQPQQEPAPNALGCLFLHEYLAHLSLRSTFSLLLHEQELGDSTAVITSTANTWADSD